MPSPDGRELFYAANPDSLDLGLWWRDLNSGRDVRVTAGVGELPRRRFRRSSAHRRCHARRPAVARTSRRTFDQKVTLEPVTDGYTGDFDPAWFPDGSRMVLSHRARGSETSGPRRRVLPGSRHDRIGDRWRPVVSPDGTQIAFVSDRGGQRGNWTVSASGGTPRLASTVDVIDTISWSPDGQRLVYSTPRGDAPRLAILSLADGRSTPLSTPAAATAPAWAPQGDVIAYVEPRGGATGAMLKFVGADGGSRALGPAEDVRINNGVVAWSPDGAVWPRDNHRQLRHLAFDCRPRRHGSVRKLTDLPGDIDHVA